MDIEDFADIDHFSPEEFDDPEVPGSWVHMSVETVRALDRLRDATGWPIVTHNKFGVRGCVCVRPEGHSPNSRHYAFHPEGCSAVDFHFDTDADPRDQAYMVITSGFSGVGFYYHWKWNGQPLKVGFHVDLRLRPQYWKKEKGQYIYLLQ